MKNTPTPKGGILLPRLEPEKPDISMKFVENEYALVNRENAEVTQVLKFYERQPSKLETKGPRAMQTIEDGVDVEAVLVACTHRLQFLQSRLGCLENLLAIHHLEIVLNLLAQRRTDRVARGVEGTTAR